MEPSDGGVRARGDPAARVRVLGTLDVVGADGVPVAMSSPKLRRLLAALVVDAGAVRSVDRLADIIWGDDGVPASPTGALHNLVSRLRAQLRGVGAGLAVVTRPPGYVLELGDAELDARAFERRARAARDLLDHDPAQAAALLDQALGLWRGDAYAEFADDAFARTEVARLDELRTVAREDRVAAALAAARPDEAVVLAERLSADHPLRERPRRQLMLALYRVGRQAEALAVYRAYRERLDGELGLDPSEELQRLERDILRADLPGPGAAGVPDAVVAQVPGAVVTQVAARDHADLPGLPRDLVGRDDLLAAVGAAIAPGRVVTLIGPGGVGKTSVALHAAAAAAAAGAWSGGVWWCDLVPVTAPAAVAEVVVTVLGVQLRQGLRAVERVVEYLRPARALLVVDNAEHVVDAVAELVSAVTRGCPQVAVLVTTRERLGVDGERVLPVPPLPVPPAGAHAPTAAVELFARRAADVAAGFAVGDHNAEAVAEICRRLDGVPLALELAAARMRSMTPAELVERLSWRFRLLRGGPRGADLRHRSLRAVVDWSYELLDERARMVFDRLAVFAGSFTLTAAEAVVAQAGDGVDARDVADVLSDLVDRSMVVARPAGASTRFTLLESLRAYARERLDERGGTPAACRAHAAYHVALAERAAAALYGPDHLHWGRTLDGALDELRAAHAWALEHDIELALRLVASLAVHAEERLLAEPLHWARRTVAAGAAAGGPPDLLAQGYAVASIAARFDGDLAGARALAERAVALAEQAGAATRVPAHVLAEVAFYQGDIDEVERILGRTGDGQVAPAERTWQAWVAMYDTLAPAYRGTRAEAIAAGERFVAQADAEGDPPMMGWARYALAEAVGDADPPRALGLLDDALARARAAESRFLTGVVLVAVASLRARHGAPEAARAAFVEVIRWWHRAGNWAQQWTTVRNVVDLLLRLGRDDDAAVLHGAVLARGSAPPPFGADAQRLADAEATLRARMGPEAFAAASARGAAMRDGDVIAWVLGTLGAAATAEHGAPRA